MRALASMRRVPRPLALARGVRRFRRYTGPAHANAPRLTLLSPQKSSRRAGYSMTSRQFVEHFVRADAPNSVFGNPAVNLLALDAASLAGAGAQIRDGAGIGKSHHLAAFGI